MTTRRPSGRKPRPSPIQPPRSTKAGLPPAEPAAPPRVRRRHKTAAAALRKDTMVLQAPEGPRALWGRTKPKVKKG
jgi:hypothetical protein